MSGFLGNPKLKPVGYVHEFTQEQIREIERCRRDPEYFIENYCYIINLDQGLQKFTLFPYQRKAIKHILGHRKGILMMPRQQGKTVTAAACILWYVLFQDEKTVAILANKGDTAREVLSRLQLMYEELPIWMQQGVITWNKGDIALENRSVVFTRATTASGIRGRSVNWLYVDEAAIIPNNIAEQFFASVMPTISSGTTTKILLTSTPLGYNHFWKFWNEAMADKNGFVPLQIHYWEHPGRDEVWAEGERKTLGETKFNQEVLCQFLGSSNTLLSGTVLGRLSSVDPILHTEDGLDIYTSPEIDRTYAIIVDTARGVGGDYSAFTVIDVTETPYRLVGKFRSNTIAPLLFPNFIWKVAKDYNDAWILVETNDIGRQVADVLREDLEYDRLFGTVVENKKTILSGGFAKTTELGVRTTKSVKRMGCFTVKSLIEENKLLIPDADTIMELSTFVEKNGSYQADESYHDDLVMTLVLFGWMTTNMYFRELTNVDVRERMYKQQMEQVENSLTPFGIIDRGEDTPFVLEDNELWFKEREIPWSNW